MNAMALSAVLMYGMTSGMRTQATATQSTAAMQPAQASSAAQRANSESPPPPASRPRLPPYFVRKTLDTGEAQPREYVVYVPPKHRVERAWPVLIFLHGSGERGTNTAAHTMVGLGPYIAARHLDDFPFVTIFPQAADMWFRGRQEEWVWRMLAAVQAEYRTDPQRVYITGISMGGFGAWEMAMHHPDRVAAIVPICGGSQEMDLAPNLRSVGVWAFHGALDKRVPVAATQSLIAALHQDGQQPRYTEFPTLGHACWNRAYDDERVYEWLLTQRRETKPRRFDYVAPRDAKPPWQAWWLRIDAIDAAVARPTVSGEIRADGRILLSGEGVAKATLMAEEMPMAREGPEVTVEWNGRAVFKGALRRDVSVRCPRRAAAR